MKDVTIPKFPPPPRIAQKRSGFESADAVRTLTIGADDLCLHEVVAREPVLAAEPTLTASEREPGDTRVRDDSTRRGEAVELRLPVDVTPQRAALRTHQARVRIDEDPVHQREVDQHPAVGARQPGDRMPAAAHSDLEAVRAREVHGVDDVRGAGALDDQPRSVGLHGVVRRPHPFVPRVFLRQDVAADEGAELVERFARERCLHTRARREDSGH